MLIQLKSNGQFCSSAMGFHTCLHNQTQIASCGACLKPSREPLMSPISITPLLHQQTHLAWYVGITVDRVLSWKDCHHRLFSPIVGIMSSNILKASQKRERSSLIFLYLLPKICIYQLGHSNLFWQAVKNSIHLFYLGGHWGLPDQQLIKKNTMKFSGKRKKMEKIMLR